MWPFALVNRDGLLILTRCSATVRFEAYARDFPMLIFFEHEPSLSSSSTLTQRIPLLWRESGKHSPSLFFHSFSMHWRLQDTSQKVKRRSSVSNRPRRTPAQPHPTQVQPPMIPAPLFLLCLPQIPQLAPNSQFSSRAAIYPTCLFDIMERSLVSRSSFQSQTTSVSVA